MARMPGAIGGRVIPAVWSLVVGVFYTVPDAARSRVYGQEAPTERVAAKLICGSHSANPTERKSFQFDLQFDVYGSLWMSDRKMTSQTGEEKFRGVLSPSGAMLIAGLGKADDGTAWSYEFSGTRPSRGATVLKGSLRTEQPKGIRTCSLTF